MPSHDLPQSRLVEIQIDRVVGPTHHYGGLGVGNVASQSHAGQRSFPRAAAIQGIEKMRRVASLGVPQVAIPPQRRPVIAMLRSLGFSGTDAQVLSAAFQEQPAAFSAAWSASAMWTANAATVSASSACRDGRTHLTVANLSSSLHRSLEADETLAVLQRLFAAASVDVHPALASAFPLRDEGAANHMRLSDARGLRGIDLFVHGDRAGDEPPEDSSGLGIHRPRQGLLAFQAIAMRHGLALENTYFLKQHPRAIDAGAFHNDVVAISHENVWIHHQWAYQADEPKFAAIEQRFREVTGMPLVRIAIPDDVMPLQDAIASYLFNAQVLRTASGELVMLCPAQVDEIDGARRAQRLILKPGGPIDRIETMDLRQSMHNGGGPACLRLRVPLSDLERARLPHACLIDDRLADRLIECVEAHYPESLALGDLVDPACVEMSQLAVDALEQILGLESRSLFPE